MKCTKCQFENRETRKFCAECGAKLAILCPKCSSENLPGEKFCGECGQNLILPSEAPLRDLSFDEKIDKIQRYLPEGLTEKILSQRDRIEGERKQVTVMFCDMEGYTALTQRLGAEEAYAVMDQVYEILIHKVHDYGGTVNEMTGDGIVALFGAPIALEDAPQRAIRSAMAIHREMVKFSDRMGKERAGVPSLKMRVGIHSGPVVVGTLGNDLRVEFKAVGDTVNLASRMEELARPGTTYVTEDTFRLTEGLFRFEALGEKQVKGKEEPVNVYQVIAPSTRRTRFDVSAERGLTPFVGRDRELEILLDGFERAKTGRGQAFSIVSEAGVGKSRLLYEFRKAVTNENPTFLEGRCLSYSQGIAYHPFIDILKANFDIREEDRASGIMEKLREGLEVLGVEQSSTLPYLLELLSVEDAETVKVAISPEAKRDRIVDSLRRIVLKGSEIRPLIVAFEDLHWMDKTSEEVLRTLLEAIPGARVLLIFSYRPEFVPTWGGKSFHSQLTLSRLSNRESLSMVTHLLGTESIDRNLEELILEKTEGVPFFIEEFVRSLKDLRIIERRDDTVLMVKGIREIKIPSTIQDVIMARVDSLPEAAKEVLQAGSVIGRELSLKLLRRVTGLPEQELLSRLSRLKDSEFLYERGIYPETSYTFKHALTQEVAYNGLLSKRRKEIHENIGKAIEETYSEKLEEFYEKLAHHYSQSENHEEAYHYLTLSGEKASRTYSNEEAYSFYIRAIEALGSLPNTEENRRSQVQLTLSMSGPMLLLGFPEGSLRILQKGETLSEELDDRTSLAALYGSIGRLYSYKGNPLQGMEYAEPRFHTARNAKDIHLMVPLALSLCTSYQGYGGAYKFETFVPEVITLLENTQRQYEYFGYPFNPYVYLCGIYGYALSLLGDFSEAQVYLEKAFRFTSALDDVISMGFSSHYYGAYYIEKGCGQRTIEYAQNSIQYLEQGGFQYLAGIARWNLGLAHWLLGDLVTAQKQIEKGLDIQSNTPVTLFLPWYFLGFGIVYHDLGDLEKAKKHAQEAYEFARRNGERWAEGRAKIWLGRIIAKKDVSERGDAEEYILQGIKILREFNLRPSIAAGHFFLGELYANAGRKEEAFDELNRAKEMVEEMDMEYWPEKIKEVLDKL